MVAVLPLLRVTPIAHFKLVELFVLVELVNLQKAALPGGPMVPFDTSSIWGRRWFDLYVQFASICT